MTNCLKVSVPYEITLLSNEDLEHKNISFVSVPYEITLLSNKNFPISKKLPVSVPYEITLLSNVHAIFSAASPFQYLMKLHYSQTNVSYL